MFKFINRLSLPATLLALFLVSSCGNDPDPTPVSKVVGKWSLVSTTTTMTINGVSLKTYLIGMGLSAEDADNYVTTFEEMFTITEYFATLEFKVEGSWEGTNGTDRASGTWRITSDDKTLFLINNQGATQQMNIEKVNDTELWLNADVNTNNATVPVPDQFKYSALIKLKRI